MMIVQTRVTPSIWCPEASVNKEVKEILSSQIIASERTINTK